MTDSEGGQAAAHEAARQRALRRLALEVGTLRRKITLSGARAAQLEAVELAGTLPTDEQRAESAAARAECVRLERELEALRATFDALRSGPG